MEENLQGLERVLGHRFENIRYLLTAVTHSSFANEQRRETEYNERLEFLGDSVLSIVVSEYLFTSPKHLPEGELTRVRAALVCENSCYEFAKKIGLGQYLRLGRGEDKTQPVGKSYGRAKPSGFKLSYSGKGKAEGAGRSGFKGHGRRPKK